MKNTKKILSAVLIGAMVLASGCGEVKYEPSVSSIFVKKDGTIVSADIEDFSGENYSVEELTAYVEEAVSTYNSANGSEAKAYSEKDLTLPVAIQSIGVKDGKASLFLNYQKASDYVAFTGTQGMDEGIDQAYIGLLGEASMADVSFVKADGSEASADAVQKAAKDTVLMIEGGLDVYVEGTVEYVSQGVTVTGKNTVRTMSEGISYVIFK